jgi:tyrosine-protein phosphatase SIW14
LRPNDLNIELGTWNYGPQLFKGTEAPMPRALQIVFGVLIATLLVAAPLAYSRHRYKELRNFHEVKEGVLYRSGQMTLAGLKRAIADYGIKTVVTLRDSYIPGNLPPDLAEEEFCTAEEINYYRIPPRTWSSPCGEVPAEKGIKVFLDVMDNPQNYPVLIHCFAGSHRTGAYCAVYRMEFERWSNADAVAETKAFGYDNLDDEWDILNYLEQYRPRWQTKTPAAK